MDDGFTIIENNLNYLEYQDISDQDDPNTQVIAIPFSRFIHDGLDTYQGDRQAILNQLDLDYPRNSIYLNGKRIVNVKSYLRFLTKYIRDRNLRKVLILVCLQSIYGMAYEIIFNRYSGIKHQDLYLSGFNFDQQHNLHQTLIQIKNKQIHISIQKNLRLFRLSDDEPDIGETLKVIKLSINVSLNKWDPRVYKSTLKLDEFLDKQGDVIITWTLDDINEI